jgi:hypothetical protein
MHRVHLLVTQAKTARRRRSCCALVQLLYIAAWQPFLQCGQSCNMLTRT